MPKPSQNARNSYNYKDFLLSYSQTQFDIDEYTKWLKREEVNTIGAIAMIIEAEWSIRYMHSRTAEVFISCTCKRSGNYLEGYTISFADLGLDWATEFIAFFVIAISTLTGDQIDDVLDLGLGALVADKPGKGKKSNSEEDIPF